MYKEASKLKMRFQTAKGNLSVEQLWDLDLPTLDALAVSLEEQYKNSKGKSFLDKTATKDKKIKLAFDLVLDVLQSKVEESEKLKEAREIKLHNEKIMDLIEQKQDESLQGKSISDLKKMLKEYPIA